MKGVDDIWPPKLPDPSTHDEDQITTWEWTENGPTPPHRNGEIPVYSNVRSVVLYRQYRTHAAWTLRPLSVSWVDSNQHDHTEWYSDTPKELRDYDYLWRWIEDEVMPNIPPQHPHPNNILYLDDITYKGIPLILTLEWVETKHRVYGWAATA